MSFYDWISSAIIDRIERTGEFTLLIVSLLLFFNYLGLIDFNKIWPPLGWILWSYLILNIGLVNVFIFLRNKDNPTCPKCKRKLHEIKEYECPKCGKLKFGDKL